VDGRLPATTLLIDKDDADSSVHVAVPVILVNTGVDDVGIIVATMSDRQPSATENKDRE
jgi:hypothetical protein